MKYLFIFNDSPYGNQRSHNGLRVAMAMSRKEKIAVFLMGDGVTCSLAGLTPAHADYNPQEMLTAIAATGAPILACGTCMESRGLTAPVMIPAVKRGSMDELLDWVDQVEKIFNY